MVNYVEFTQTYKMIACPPLTLIWGPCTMLWFNQLIIKQNKITIKLSRHQSKIKLKHCKRDINKSKKYIFVLIFHGKLIWIYNERASVYFEGSNRSLPVFIVTLLGMMTLAFNCLNLKLHVINLNGRNKIN